MDSLRVFRLLALVLPLAIAGCGGGGGSSGGSSGRAPLNLFVTDSFRDDYDQVWVRIHAVELIDSSGGVIPVFSDDAGRVVDVRSLRDDQGERFSFLARASAPAATYREAQITLADSVTLIPRGADAGQSVQMAADIPRDAGNRPRIQFPLRESRPLGQTEQNLIIDFDLAGFSLASGRLRPSIRESAGPHADNPARQERDHFVGTVSGLSGPPVSFELALPNGARIPVATDENTALYNADASPNPALQNGTLVQVEGIFHPGLRKLLATDIRVLRGDPGEGDHGERAGVVGAPVEINADAARFYVRLGRAFGFTPTHRFVRVQTNEQTVFKSRDGVTITRERFFAALPEAELVLAAGTYNAATNTLTARIAKLHGPHGERLVRAAGTPVEIRPDVGAFRIRPVTEWEGFDPPDRQVNVITHSETRFFNRRGEEIRRGEFFELLRSAQKVIVEGVYDRETNTIRAAAAKLAGEGGDPPHVTAVGLPDEIAPGEGRFRLNPVLESRGFTPREGVVWVQTGEQTVFRDAAGQPITREAFFAFLQLNAGARRPSLRVEGRYTAETNTIAAEAVRIRGD